METFRRIVEVFKIHLVKTYNLFLEHIWRGNLFIPIHILTAVFVTILMMSLFAEDRNYFDLWLGRSSPVDEAILNETLVLSSSGIAIRLPGVFQEDIEEAKRLAEERRKIEQQKFDAKVKRLHDFIISFNGDPGYAAVSKTILEVSNKCGTDYRLITAISGAESTFGRQSFSYNPYGYLNGKKYRSWEQSVSDIICDFAKNYYQKGLTTPEKVVKKYGPHNKPAWLFAVNFFYKKLTEIVENG